MTTPQILVHVLRNFNTHETKSRISNCQSALSILTNIAEAANASPNVQTGPSASSGYGYMSPLGTSWMELMGVVSVVVY